MTMRFSTRTLRYWIGRLGPAGFAGLALLAAAAITYTASIQPLEVQKAQLRAEVDTTKRRLAEAAQQRGELLPVTAQEKLGAFYAKFPERDATPDLLEMIFAAADEQQVVLEEGEYTPGKAKDIGLDTLRINLPVKGSYPQIRKFIAAALAAVPNLALENVVFKREKVDDGSVDAKVTLVLYLGRSA
jgi:Tfp pilus assembly protein PilO